MIYGESGMLKRAQKLAARPRCGFTWKTVRERSDEWPHECVRIKDHAADEHRCECGTTKTKGAK